MTSTFDHRMQELSDRVGHGDLVGHVVVDQAYAQFQHENLRLHHPRGGEAKYLERPLFENRDYYMQLLAEDALHDIHRGMIRSVEHLAGLGGVESRAPLLWGDLRRSGHPIVEDNGQVVYDREPHARRLTESELREKARLTPMPGWLLGYIWWKVMHKQHPPNWKGGV